MYMFMVFMCVVHSFKRSVKSSQSQYEMGSSWQKEEKKCINTLKKKKLQDQDTKLHQDKMTGLTVMYKHVAL